MVFLELSVAGSRSALKVKVFFAGILLLAGILLCMVISLILGTIDVPVQIIWKVLTEYDGSKARTVVWDLRFPRAIIAAFVGANLAVAGAVMQCLTRNPLAEPKLMGVSAGAAAVAVFIELFLVSLPLAWFSPLVFIGAAIGGSFVYVMAGRGRAHPIQLALAGVAVSAFLHAITVGILVLLGEDAGAIYSWLAGGLNGLSWEHVRMIWPWSLAGIGAALILSQKMNVLELGEEIAQGLGIRLGTIRLFLIMITIILAGSSVSISGSISFIGLVIPHIVRKLFGSDYKIVIPMSALLGALLLIIADFAARMLVQPIELPVGIFTAAIGCPYFLYLVRKQSD